MEKNAEIYNEIKKIDPHFFLELRGIKTIRKGNKNFFSIRTERVPSVCIFKSGERFLWHDFGSGESGSIIDLVMIIDGKNISEAVEFLRAYIGNVPAVKYDYGKKKKDPPEGQTEVTIKPETNPHKIQLLNDYASSRAIKNETIKNSIVEYVTDSKFFYLGLPNENGGYCLRSSLYKGNKGNTGISLDLRQAVQDTITYIVEGMFDYLSLLQLNKLPFNCIILNSTKNYKQAVDTITKYKISHIKLMLDNDPAGIETAQKITNLFSGNSYFNVEQSIIPNKYQDANEMLCDIYKNEK